MATFAYEARKEDGELVTGIIAAADMADAGLKLAAKELFIVKLAPADRDQAGHISQGLSRLKAKRARVVWFVNQLSIMVETGITIGEALDCLARQATDPVLQEVLEGVSSGVQEGRPLSDAMDGYPRTFPRVMTAMVRAAEHSGTLGPTLNRTAQYLLKEQQIMRRFRGALMYPAFMFLMCVGVTIFLLTTILPRFAVIFAQKGAALPGPTRLLLGINGVFHSYWGYLAAVSIAAVTGTLWFIRTPGGKQLLDWVQLNAPLLGNVVNKHHQSRFFRAAAMLIDAGVSLSDVLGLVRAISSNGCYKALWARVEEGVQNGESITKQLRTCPYISEIVTQMVDCGDRSGRLGMVLGRLADVLEDEYDTAIKTVTQFIEPLMIVIMGSIIGFIAIALLLPMFKASTLVAH
jgi:type IV pilus assembly protein PilC